MNVDPGYSNVAGAVPNRIILCFRNDVFITGFVEWKYRLFA